MDSKNISASLDVALRAHAHWKVMLLAAVEAGDVLDVATIKRDDCCELGKWLQSEGRRVCGDKPEFVNLLNKHKDFHEITGVVAGIVNGKDYETVRPMLGVGSQFAAASMDVGVAIVRLKKTIDSNHLSHASSSSMT